MGKVKRRSEGVERVSRFGTHEDRGRARLQSCHKDQKKDSGTANPPDRTRSRSPAHLSSSPSAAL
jgi:hypothetical protein